jgi:hypothetical protein
MRIIRVRRGFTTNSSGANEYLETPPDIPQEPADAYEADGADAAPAKAAGDAAASAVIKGVFVPSPPARERSGDAGVESVAAQPDGGVPGAAPSPVSGNVLVLLLVLVGVAALFAVERAIRFARQRVGGRRRVNSGGGDGA